MTRLSTRACGEAARRRLRWLSAAICLLAATAAAQDVQAPRLALPAFIRAYVPAATPRLWPREAEPLTPVPPAEFEALVRQLQADESPQAAPRAAASQCRISARLVGEDLLVGTLTLRIVDVAEPTRLPLDPCRVAIQSATWRPLPDNKTLASDQAEAPPPRPAVLSADGQGNLSTELAEPGELMATWSLRGRRDNSGAAVWPLEFPWAASTIFELATPAGAAVELPGAAPLPAIDEPSSGAVRRFALPPLGGAVLRITLPGAAPVVAEPAPVRVRTTHDVRLSGVATETIMQFEPPTPLPDSIVVALSRELELDHCRAGDRTLTWREVSADDRLRRIEIALDTSAAGGTTVGLRAHSPLQLDRPWRTPSLLPVGAAWAEATCVVRVERPLAVERVDPSDARVSRWTPLMQPAPGQAYELQFFGPDAAAQFTLSTRRPPRRVETLTIIECQARERTADVLIRLQAVESALAEWQAAIRSPWRVREVTAGGQQETPVAWRIETQADGTALLRVQSGAGREATPLERLRLRLDAPLDRSAARLTVDDLLPVDLSQEEVQLAWLEVRPSGQGDWSPVAAARPLAWSHTDLTATDRGLWPDAPQGWVFDAREPLAELALTRPTVGQPFDAQVRSELLLRKGSSQERHRLLIEPQGSELSVVRVLLAGGPERPWQWDATSVGAQLLAQPENSANGGAEETAWDLVFSPPLRQPLEVTAVSAPSDAPGGAFRPAQLPAADEAPGRCVIRSGEARGWRLTPHGLHRTAPTAEEAPEALAAYDYNATEPASVEVSVDSDASGVSGPIVWRLRTESRCVPGLLSDHRTLMHVRAGAGDWLSIELPPGGDVTTVELDGRAANWRATDGAPHVIEVELPADRAAQLTLGYRLPAPKWRLWGGVSRALPRPKAPVVSQAWTVWMPDDYAVDAPLDAGARQSLVERLAGPFARQAGARPWRPWSSLGQGLAAWLWPDAAAAQQTARTAWGAFGHSLRQRRAERTWQETLQTAAERLQAQGLELLLDAAALSEAGIVPTDVCPSAVAKSDTERGRQWLARNHLLLLVADWRLTLTTRAAASEFSAGEAWSLDDDGDRQAVALALGDARRLVEGVAVAQWSAAPALVWETPRLSADMATLAGWRAWTMDPWVETEPAAVRITWLAAMGAAAALCGAAVCWRLGRRRPRAAAAWAAALVALSLIAVPLLAVCAAAALWGTLACAAVAWRRAATEKLTNSQLPKLEARLVRIALAGCLVAGQASASAQNRPAGAVERRGVPRVLIPVDPQGQPNGDPYQTPSSLWAELLGRQRSIAVRRGATVEQVRYRAALRRDAASGRLALAELSLHLDGAATLAGQPLLLPLRVTGQRPLEQVLMNDVPQAAVWDEEADALRVTAPAPGPFHLETPLVAAEAAGEYADLLEATIPSVAHSALEFELPDAAAEVEIPSALGEIQRSEDGRRIVAHLGPTPRLELRWRSGTAAPPRVEQLWWLHVQPGSLVWRLKLHVDPSQTPLEQLRLHFDPQLQWLPLDEQPAGAKVELDESRPNSLLVRWPDRRLETRAVELAWLARSAEGIGRIRLPNCEISAADTTRAWLAVNVDETLDHTSAAAEEVPRAAFLERWGEAEQSPDLVRQLDPRRPRWEINTRPKPPLVVSRERAAWLIAPSPKATGSLPATATGALIYSAELQTTRGARFEYSLRVPSAIAIERVGVTEQGVPRLRRWFRDDQGRVTILLSEPTSAAQTLTVTGRMTLPLGEAVVLPRVALDDVQAEEHRTEVQRRPELDVGVVSHAALDDAPRPRGPGALPVSALDSRDAASRVAVRVAAVPLQSLRQLTVVQHSGEDWLVETRLHWSDAAGPSQAVCLSVPAELRSKLEFVTACPHRWVEAPESDEANLTLLPPGGTAAAKCTLRLRIEDDDGQFALPRIAAVGAPVEHTVVLPIQFGLGPAVWKTRGLTPTAMPEHLESATVSAESHRAWRAAGERYAARVEDVPSDEEGPRVERALYQWQATGGRTAPLAGVACFDIRSGDAATAALRLPPGAEVREVWVQGQTLRESLERESNALRVPLLDQTEPQRVEILLTVSSAAVRSQDAALLTPRIDGWPVAQTLHRYWTLRGAGLAKGTLDPAEFNRLLARPEVARDSNSVRPVGYFPSPAQAWRASLDPRRRAILWSGDAAPDEFYRALAADCGRRGFFAGEGRRWAAAAALLAALIWLGRDGRLGRWCVERPYVVWGLAGAAAWLWLAPPWLGAAILLAGLAWQWRLRRTRRQALAAL